MRVSLFATVAAAALAASSMANAAVVAVTSTVSGSAGAWVHDFTVVNNLPNTNNIYFFGVVMPTGRNIAGSPGGFNPNDWPFWNQNGSLGGSNTGYNNNWINGSIAPGASLGGFKVLDTGTTAATNIGYFAFAFGGSYAGPECFNCGGNPGFEGLVNGGTGAVPEPASWAMLIAGFGLAGAVMRRRRAVAAA